MSGGGNLGALGLAQLFRIGSGFAINVLLMRALGVDGFGVYGTILTAVGIAAFGANLGMDRLINRELSRRPERADVLVPTGLATTLGLSVVTGVLVIAWSVGADGRGVFVAGTALAAVAMGARALAQVPEAAFHALRRMMPPAKAQMAGRVVLVVTTAGLVVVRPDVIAVFAAQLLDGIVTFVLSWRAWRATGAAMAPVRLDDARSLVRESVPFGLNLLFGSVYLTVDVLMLAAMRDDAEVGLYRGAVSLIALFPVVANTLTMGMYPKMARHLGSPDRAGDELGFAVRVLLLVSAPAAVGGMLVAEPLMVFLGGDEYAGSALPFLVMAPMLPIRFVNHAYAMALSTLDRQADRTWGTAIAAVVNVALNLWLIPIYGALGCAAATLLTEIVLAAWMAVRARGLVVGVGFLGAVGRVSVAAGVMAAALVVLPPVHVVVDVLVGAVVFVAAGRATGAWSPADLRRLRRV